MNWYLFPSHSKANLIIFPPPHQSRTCFQRPQEAPSMSSSSFRAGGDDASSESFGSVTVSSCMFILSQGVLCLQVILLPFRKVLLLSRSAKVMLRPRPPAQMETLTAVVAVISCLIQQCVLFQKAVPFVTAINLQLSKTSQLSRAFFHLLSWVQHKRNVYQ